MVDTGVRVRKTRIPAGTGVSIGVVCAAIGLLLGADRLLLPQSFANLGLPLLEGILAVGILGFVVVPILRQLKAGQIIRQEGPQAHLKKQGTPTMGGIFIVPTGLFLGVLLTNFDAKVIACSLVTLAFAFVGWVDDWKSLTRHSNTGLSPRGKLILQTGFTVLFSGWFLMTQDWQTATTLQLPFNLSLPLGVLFLPLVLFVFLGSSNATNLTDGLDGLAGGTGGIALLGLALLVFPVSRELAIFCAVLGGSYLGFLVHNRYRASVFMGDTGSLALGAALASVAVLGNVLWGLLIIGLIFVWESLSVILQVLYYKATKDGNGVGKRLFKMAPFHHHLELVGWHELQIAQAFYMTALALVVLALLLKSF
ncbi:MAG: phospho-N-acetylmuramoyl-pentapeptide-transferase [Pseudanabaenaceae cyanobacterium]|jgi:phospho-N-acetylmuramoyl-pentapeptide-transferase